LYNNADDFEGGSPKTKATATSNGEVALKQLFQQRSTCLIDVAYFPFDDQTCTLKYGLWAYSELQVDLISSDNKSLDLSNYVESDEWFLTSFKVKRHVEFYPQTPNDPFPDLRFTLKIRRRVLPFFFNV
jgi:nicotinic acetylcholine receptor